MCAHVHMHTDQNLKFQHENWPVNSIGLGNIGDFGLEVSVTALNFF